jgi:pilus assembly protein CpaE
MPASRVHDLAEVCEPGVTVIAIGDHNEIGLFRDLLQAGVADYLVKPLTPQLLARALTARGKTGESGPIHRKLATTVALVGARGGAGSTTLAVNLAWYLANRQKRRILLLDLDLHGDSAITLGIKASSGLRDALVNPHRVDHTLLERVMTAVGERLFVLSSEEPLRDEISFTPEAVETLVSALREQFHYIVLDVPRISWPPYRKARRRYPHHGRRPDLAPVRDATRLRSVLGEGDAAHRSLFVVNRHGEGGRRAVTLREMHNIVDLRPRAVIPFQPTLFANAASSPRVAAARRGKFADALGTLALDLSGRPPGRRRWWRAAK